MEWAANQLVRTVRHVLVRAAYDNDIRVRFRADDLDDPRCYFNKVASQHKRWRENGGALITWKNNNLEGPCDAILLVECPKSIDAIWRAVKNTRVLGVVYDPPTWRPFEEQIRKRHAGKHPRKCARQIERLEIVRALVERLPVFSRPALSRALAASSRLSCAPEQSEAAAPPADTSG